MAAEPPFRAAEVPSASAQTPAPSSAQAATLRRDRALLQRWRGGDQQAGLELLDHYAGLVRMVAFRLGVREQQAVLDLYQDLVVRVLEQLPTLDEKVTASFAGWLAWQVRDLVQRRRRQRAPDVPFEPWMGESAADPAPRAAARDAIARCSGQLPERERAVFELRYQQGLSLQEVADRLQSNANAVAQGIFRLVRRLRACLRVQGYELAPEEA